MADNYMSDKLHEKFTSMAKSWERALENGRKLVEKESIEIRNELKGKLEKCKAKQLELTNNYQRLDAQFNLEYNRIVGQTQINISPNESSRNLEFAKRNQQIELIYNDTQNELKIFISNHKDRVKRMEQFLWQKTLREKRIFHNYELTAGKTAPNSVPNSVQLKSNYFNEIFRQLVAIRAEIVKKIEDLAEMDKKEAEDMLKLEKQSFEFSQKEKKSEMTSFIDKATYFFK